jgi:YD repeat-containing protein
MEGSGPDIHIGVTPAEVRGRHGTAAVPDSAFTLIDGPRTDVLDHTRIWVNRWGAPTRIRDALGNETQIFRDHAAFPGLVTRTIAPTATTRGVVRHAWAADAHDRHQLPGRRSQRHDDVHVRERRVAVLPHAGACAGRRVDAHRLRQRDGEPALGAGGSQLRAAGELLLQRAGQVDSVRMPTVSGGTVRPVERYGYDARGNLTSVTTPTGIVTRYHADAIGRDTLVVTPTTVGQFPEERRQRIVYDAVGRVIRTTDSAPRYDPTRVGRFDPDPNETESVTVHTWYNAEGQPDSVRRDVSPNPANLTGLWTRWQYDAAGRITRTDHPDLTVETFVHEGNGQSLRHRSRGCGASTCEIVTRYDVLGRDSMRVVPHRDFSGSSWTPTYRLDPNTSLPANRLAADTSRFTYDAMGNLRTADNREARVRRNYYRGGLLHTDSTWIRDYGSAAFNQVYGQRMVYDRNGRRLDLYYPSGTGPGTTPRVQYGYHTETGLLSSIVDLGGNAFTYEHDAQGNTHKVFMPGGLVDTRVLDLENRLAYRSVPGYRSVNYQYTQAGQLANLWADGNQWSFEGQYTGLGSVVRTEGVTHEFYAPSSWSIHPNDLSVDPLGNVVYSPVHSSQNVIVAYPTETRTSYSWSGAVTTVITGDTIVSQGGVDGTAQTKEFRISAEGSFMADGSGNQALSSRYTVREWHQYDPMAPLRTVQEFTRSYYGWDGKLRVVDQTKHYCHAGWCDSFEFGDGVLVEPPAVFEEYRYDALGRRIMVRGRPDPRCTLAGCEVYLDTYVWDGAQILSEWRQGPAGGRVTYTHGPGIDAPVSLWRSGTTMVLHANRGRASSTWRRTPTARGWTRRRTRGRGCSRRCTRAILRMRGVRRGWGAWWRTSTTAPGWSTCGTGT